MFSKSNKAYGAGSNGEGAENVDKERKDDDGESLAWNIPKLTELLNKEVNNVLMFRKRQVGVSLESTPPHPHIVLRMFICLIHFSSSSVLPLRILSAKKSDFCKLIPLLVAVTELLYILRKEGEL